MSTINLERVDFHYSAPYAQVFSGLSLAIDTSWRTAILGRNGRGKTTLLRLISGELSPTAGAVRTPLRCVRLPQAPQEPTPTRTVIRRTIAPFDRWESEMDLLLAEGSDGAIARYGEILEDYQLAGGFEIDAAIEREMAGLGLDVALLERPFDSLSGGEQTRAMIAALFLMRDVFALLDEPTNHLDIDGRRALAEYLRSKRGFVLVSHDRELLDAAVDHVVALERSDIRVIAGNYSTWKEQHDLVNASEQHRNELLRRQIASLERDARQRRTWSDAKEDSKWGAPDRGFASHRAAKMMKRALHAEARAEAAIEQKRGLLRNVDTTRALQIEATTGSDGILCQLEDATIAFGDHVVVEGVSIAIRPGERVALVGANGSGKTSIIRALVGELPLRSGFAWCPPRLRIGRAHQLPRWREGLLREHLRSEAIDETHFRNIMAAMGVVGDILDRPLETFSEGERKKVDLCRSLVEPADLFVWDEPMNYIDVIAREQIERAVIERAPTMLFVEHDARFIAAVATRVVRLREGHGGAEGTAAQGTRRSRGDSFAGDSCAGDTTLPRGLG